MAILRRKEPAAPSSAPPAPPASPARARAAPRQAAAAPADTSRVGRLRKNLDDISAELRKVTWPTREETRNLTIVVIGISAAIGSFLAGFDAILSALYTFVSDLVR